MLNLKYHTPEGVMDYLPDECEAKRAIEQKMALSFRQNGYRPIQTPAFEYYDLYADGSGDISPEKLYKFFDPQGRILARRHYDLDCARHGHKVQRPDAGAAVLCGGRVPLQRFCFVAQLRIYAGGD